MTDFDDSGRNHKVQMHKVLIQRGHTDWNKLIHDKLGKNYKLEKINTDVRQVCEVGIKLNKRWCKQKAYRKLRTRYGYKWTCDACAKEIASDNEWRWK